MTRLFGADDEFGEDAILGRMEGMKEIIEQVNKQFKDPVRSYTLNACSLEFPFHLSLEMRKNRLELISPKK